VKTASIWLKSGVRVERNRGANNQARVGLLVVAVRAEVRAVEGAEAKAEADRAVAASSDPLDFK
jgi:hypothetical protein